MHSSSLDLRGPALQQERWGCPGGRSSDTGRDTNGRSGQLCRRTLDWIQGNRGIYRKASENLQETEDVQGGDYFFQVILPPQAAQANEASGNRHFPQCSLNALKRFGSMKKKYQNRNPLQFKRENYYIKSHKSPECHLYFLT